MSLYQAIIHRKEKRALYRYLSPSCNNHNPKYCQCPWCVGNRLHNNEQRRRAAEEEEEEYYKNCGEMDYDTGWAI